MSLPSQVVVLAKPVDAYGQAFLYTDLKQIGVCHSVNYEIHIWLQQ